VEILEKMAAWTGPVVRVGGGDQDRLDTILDARVHVYHEALDKGCQMDFKSKAKVFSRTFAFLSAVLTYPTPAWGATDYLFSGPFFLAEEAGLHTRLRMSH